jgi:hypothetical protein
LRKTPGEVVLRVVLAEESDRRALRLQGGDAVRHRTHVVERRERRKETAGQRERPHEDGPGQRAHLDDGRSLRRCEQRHGDREQCAARPQRNVARPRRQPEAAGHRAHHR